MMAPSGEDSTNGYPDLKTIGRCSEIYFTKIGLLLMVVLLQLLVLDKLMQDKRFGMFWKEMLAFFLNQLLLAAGRKAESLSKLYAREDII